MPKLRAASFRRDRKGAVAIEFALVAPLFLALLFSVIEIGWTMTKVMMLERATEQTVRELRIGRAAGFTHDYVKQRICERAIIFTNCTSNLIVELIPVPDGTAYPSDDARCVNRSTPTLPVIRFNPGKRSELVYIRACATTDPLTPGLGLGLRLNWNNSNGYFISTHSVFLNEPS